MPCYLLSTPEVLSASQEQLFATEPSLLIHSHWLSFSAFPHVVGNRCCLLLLCHVPHEAWVEVSTISRSKIFPRQSPQNAQRKTSIIESSTGLAGHHWFIEWMPPPTGCKNSGSSKCCLLGFWQRHFSNPWVCSLHKHCQKLLFNRPLALLGPKTFYLATHTPRGMWSFHFSFTHRSQPRTSFCLWPS
jgi:hypothetical protein